MANTPSYVRSYEGRSLLEGVMDILTLMDIGHMPKKMQCPTGSEMVPLVGASTHIQRPGIKRQSKFECFCFECGRYNDCLLYTSDAADERSSVDLGGRRII